VLRRALGRWVRLPLTSPVGRLKLAEAEKEEHPDFQHRTPHRFDSAARALLTTTPDCREACGSGFSRMRMHLDGGLDAQA
jgi:hypothetical protein